MLVDAGKARRDTEHTSEGGIVGVCCFWADREALVLMDICVGAVETVGLVEALGAGEPTGKTGEVGRVVVVKGT